MQKRRSFGGAKTMKQKSNKPKVKSIRFGNELKAINFAARVNGTVKDLREFENRKSDFIVRFKYKSTKRIKPNGDPCPEEGRDFGYPNEYWD